MRKKDQSTKFIKYCLVDALVKLLEKGCSFPEITVAEICAEAGIGRTTYYRHFDNKNGKVEMLRFKIYGGWEEYCLNREEELKDSTMRVLLNFFYSQRDFLLLLHRNGLVMDILFGVLYLSVGPTGNEEKESAYWRAYLASGIFGFIYHWLQTEFVDPPEYVYALISKKYPI